METFGHETRRARAPHKCTYCYGTIPAGQRYERWAWSDCGRIFSALAHSRCVEMEQELMFPDDELMDWGEFRADCRDELPHFRPFPWENAT